MPASTPSGAGVAAARARAVPATAVVLALGTPGRPPESGAVLASGRLTEAVEARPRSGARTVEAAALVGLLLLLALGRFHGLAREGRAKRACVRVTQYFRGPTSPRALGRGKGESQPPSTTSPPSGPAGSPPCCRGGRPGPAGQMVARMDTTDAEADLRQGQAELAQAREDKRRRWGRSSAGEPVAERSRRDDPAREATPAGRCSHRQRESDITRTAAATAERE